MKAQIAKHNFKILNQNKNDAPPRCNCQDPAECPLPGKCTVDKLVYQANVPDNNNVESYVGLTADTFKERHYGHRQDFKKSESRTNTTLAGHIWKLKDQGKDPKIDWKVVCRASPFTPITGICNLCTSEKWHIIYKPEMATLNRRKELFNHCRHKEKLLIVKKIRKPRLRIGS